MLNLPDVKGIVLSQSFGIADFSGYMVEYIENGGKKKNLYRIVTSSFNVEPVSDSNGSSASVSQKSIKYNPNPRASLVFLTLSPTSQNSIEASYSIPPYIGFAGQQIIISNTFFDPYTIQINMVENTLDTLAYALYGNQTKTIDLAGTGGGIYRIYDEDGNVYKKYQLFVRKNEFDQPIIEVRQEIETIEANENFDAIL